MLERTGNSIYFNNFVCNIPVLGSVFSAVIKKLNAVACFGVSAYYCFQGKPAFIKYLKLDSKTDFCGFYRMGISYSQKP